MYKTILAPLDGSKRAEAVLPHIEKLAQSNDSKVVLMQVVEPFSPGVGIMQVVEPFPPDVGNYAAINHDKLVKQEKKAAVYLDRLKEEFNKKGITVSTYVVHGPILDKIIGVGKWENTDLIAIASHGRTGLSRVFYGSVAAGVLHRVDRPLLIIRSI